MLNKPKIKFLVVILLLFSLSLTVSAAIDPSKPWHPLQWNAISGTNRN